MKPLSPRQREALDFIAAYIRDHGYPPTVRDICRSMGIKSPNGVTIHLRTLERKGWITVDRGAARGIRLVNGQGFCPLCGSGREGAG